MGGWLPRFHQASPSTSLDKSHKLARYLLVVSNVSTESIAVKSYESFVSRDYDIGTENVTMGKEDIFLNKILLHCAHNYIRILSYSDRKLIPGLWGEFMIHMDAEQPMADLFKALGHPTRLKILRLLCQGDMCMRDGSTVGALFASPAASQLFCLRGSAGSILAPD